MSDELFCIKGQPVAQVASDGSFAATPRKKPRRRDLLRRAAWLWLFYIVATIAMIVVPLCQ